MCAYTCLTLQEEKKGKKNNAKIVVQVKCKYAVIFYKITDIKLIAFMSVLVMANK